MHFKLEKQKHYVFIVGFFQGTFFIPQILHKNMLHSMWCNGNSLQHPAEVLLSHISFGLEVSGIIYKKLRNFSMA